MIFWKMVVTSKLMVLGPQITENKPVKKKRAVSITK